MTRSRRIRLAILIGALGAAASLFAWARRVSETSRRASPSPAQGIDLLEPERGPLPVRREHTDPLLSAVRIRFEDASGGAVQPVAGLRNSRGEEYQLRAGTLAGEMEPDSPLRVGEYLIDASSPVSGWSSQQRLSVLRNGLYRVPFIVPVAKVRVVVLGPEGAEYRRALRYRVYPKPRFTALAMRRRDLILDLAYGDDAGGPTTPLPPWTAAEGSKFEIRCERGATLRLEVETEEGLSARSWISTQVDRKDVVVRLDPLVPASFEVGLAGRRVGGGHLLKAYAAGSLTHPDWQGRTDERGQVRLRSYAASGFPVFLLMALGADDSAAPLSYLSLTEGPEAFSVTSQMTLRTGVRLDFPGYEAPIWTVKWPFASDSSKRIIEVWLNVVQGKLSYPLMKIGQARVGADDRIRLPEYVTNPEVELRLPAPNAGIRLSPDPATRCILARTVMPLEGFVVDEEDRPLRGIEVVWSPASEGTLDPGFNPWAFRRASVRTDGDGRFSILQNAAEKGVLRAYGRAFRIAEWRISDLAKGPMKLRLERLRSCTVALTPVPGRLGATLFVRYPRLGMIGLPVPLDGRVAVPLYGGPGLHDVEAVLPRLGSTLAQLTLDRDARGAAPPRGDPYTAHHGARRAPGESPATDCPMARSPRAFRNTRPRAPRSSFGPCARGRSSGQGGTSDRHGCPRSEFFRSRDDDLEVGGLGCGAADRDRPLRARGLEDPLRRGCAARDPAAPGSARHDLHDRVAGIPRREVRADSLRGASAADRRHRRAPGAVRHLAGSS